MSIRKKSGAVLSGGALVLGLLAVTPAAHAAPSDLTHEEFIAQIENYQNEHPGDYVGLEQFVESIGGEFKVSTNITGPTTAEGAEEALAKNAVMSDGGVTAAAGSLPSDSFTVAITSFRQGTSPIVDVTGSWDWRDDFAGQTDPRDIASLGFNSSCGARSNPRATTQDLNGAVTNTTVLNNSGVATNSVVWEVDAAVSGFVNSADQGRVTVTWDTSGCTDTLQAGFIYEGNQGGSLDSISASFGALSLGYSGGTLALQKSTAPLTL
ncbi:hypothetical protein [Microbacterium sp. LMI1-1-1.1]|uniref:hypothetical protein n=1 Tax=Microbacterium sp. LMI1-1-1.1 TaxID=3135223 RepID=UPI003466F9EA